MSHASQEEVKDITSLLFENMTFSYDGKNKIFDGITFELPLDEIVWVTGAPGNGQSTLLRLLAVLQQPQSGSFFINGEDTAQMSFEEFLPFRKLIGYTFDYGGLFANRTLLDNLTLPLLYHKTCSFEEARANATALGTEYGFARQLGNRPAEVSGGLRKLTCVLRTLLTNPQMIVMDDPFTGLDSESSRKLIKTIHDRRERGDLRHVFFTSRDEAWPERMGFKPLLIENGQPRFDKKQKVAS